MSWMSTEMAIDATASRSDRLPSGPSPIVSIERAWIWSSDGRPVKPAVRDRLDDDREGDRAQRGEEQAADEDRQPADTGRAGRRPGRCPADNLPTIPSSGRRERLARAGGPRRGRGRRVRSL